MANLKTIQTDLTSYYLTHGSFAANISDMTNVPLTDTGSKFKNDLKGGLKVGGVNCIAVTAMPACKASGGNPRSSGSLNDWYGTPGGIKNGQQGVFNGGVDSFLATIVVGSEKNPLCKKVQDDPQIQSILGARYQHNGKWYGGIPIASSIY